MELALKSPAKALSLPASAYEDNAPIDLGSIAFENHHTRVFHAWLNLDHGQRRQALHDRYIFLSVSYCVDQYVANLLTVDMEKANTFVGEIIADIIFLAQEKKGLTEEWFRGLDHLAGAFTDHNYLAEARQSVALGLKTGVAKFPRIAQSLHIHAAYLDALAGRKDKAAKTALHLVHKPYLLPNRRELPKLYQKLMYILSASNHLPEYRQIIWKGASSYHADARLRGVFVNQIVKTYRGAFRAMLHGEVPLAYRLPFVFGNLDRILTDTPWLAWTRAYVIARWWHVGSLYLLDIISFKKPVIKHTNLVIGPQTTVPIKPVKRWHLPRLRRRSRKILVTRAMGGIGDVIMMTPGLKALSMRYPKAQIDFAIPKSFHSLFEHFSAVRLLDINEDDIDLHNYTKWINLTDCPAGRMESRQYPNVKRNRIEIFAQAMGISRLYLRRTSGFLPFYKISPEEDQWAKDFIRERNPQNFPVIGIQPFSADSYKNWPFMEELAHSLSKNHIVLIFHHEEIAGYNAANIYKALTPLRKSCALIAQCNRMIVVDSSLLHISAALGVLTLAIFGPTSARVFCRYYKNVKTITPNKPEFPCYPCWRNEHKPCHLTNGRESICLRSIAVQQITEALNSDLNNWCVKPSVFKRFKTWVLYGRE